MILFRSDFSKYKICSDFFTKTLYGQVFVKWMHFQIIFSLWELEEMTDLQCVYCLKIFEQIIIVAYLKKVICKRRCSEKSRKFYRKPFVLESLYNKVAGLRTSNVLQKRLWHRCIVVKFTNCLRAPILKSICEPLHASP